MVRLPPEEFFLDEFATHKKIKKVKAFREAFTGEWNFREELHKYLVDDIRVLRAGVVSLLQEYFEFQETLKREAPVPFHCFTKPFFTASSFAYSLYRYYSLDPNTVYLTENQRGARKTSRDELAWVGFESWKNKLEIRTAYNHPDGQRKVGKYYLDGYNKETGTAWEFNGCLLHGHVAGDKNCPLSRGLSPISKTPYGRTCQEAYDAWLHKKAALEMGERPLDKGQFLSPAT